MVLGHHEILVRVSELFPYAKPYKIGAASADVCVGTGIIKEDGKVINISDHHEEFPWIMEPGEFLLVDMIQWVTVPQDLACMFLLKSSVARMGYSHVFAGWIDPGWDGILTMEIKNYNQMKPLPLWPGMPIGQLIYFSTVMPGKYKGRYQGSLTVSGVKEEIEYDAGS